MDNTLKDKLKLQILAIARQNVSGITYSALASLDGFSGYCNLINPDYPHIRFWEGVSEEAGEAVIELYAKGDIAHEPTDELAYMASGAMLEIPLFTAELAASAAELPHPHWLPVLVISPTAVAAAAR